MSDNGRAWDKTFTRTGSKENPLLGITLPTPLSRALLAQGFTRFVLSVDDAGIHLRPYKGAPKERPGEMVALPTAWGDR